MRAYFWTAVSAGHVMMGATMQNGPISLTVRGSALRSERDRAGLTLAELAAKFRRGVTRERIRQIEAGNVSGAMAADYRRALKIAKAERDELKKAVLKVRRKFCDSQNSRTAMA